MICCFKHVILHAYALFLGHANKHSLFDFFAFRLTVAVFTIIVVVHRKYKKSYSIDNKRDDKKQLQFKLALHAGMFARSIFWVSLVPGHLA